MIRTKDILDENELEEAFRDGLVRRQDHPYLPLCILNYTQEAQTGWKWDDTIQQCRGLICNRETTEVVARPFPKFFNYGEESPDERKWDPAEPVAVTDKLDGSLGVMYPTDEGYAIATRGSFTSEQAYVGSRILWDLYPDFEPRMGYTMMFEIIYPENRIVVDYGDAQDLVLLGAVCIENGLTLTPQQALNLLSWPGPVAERFDHASLDEALSEPPREGKEGLVVHFLDSDQRVKLKQEDYVRLHRIVTGLNAKVVWEVMDPANSSDIEELVAELPEEFIPWVRGVQRDLDLKALEYLEYVHYLWDKHECLAGDRKSFALAIKDAEPWARSCLFNMLEGRDLMPIIWKQIKPVLD